MATAIWGAHGKHTRRHRFVVLSLKCAEGDDYDDPFVERPHSRWPNGQEPHLIRASEVRPANNLPRCKLCAGRTRRAEGG